jgi:hypothetical protein
VTQILLLLVSPNEDAKREAVNFANKAVRLSLMALPKVRNSLSQRTSSVGPMGMAFVDPWILHLLTGQYWGAIADIPSIIEEIPKAMASTAAAVAG